MSRYTTQLRWIVEQLSEGLTVPEGQEYPNAVYNYIGLLSYPLFDPSYRSQLNDKIINHFYFQEIGFETPKQFAWMLKRTMNEIMPKYNALYEAQLDLDAHPLADYWRHIDETRTGEKTGSVEFEKDTDGTTSGTTSDTEQLQGEKTLASASDTSNDVDEKVFDVITKLKTFNTQDELTISTTDQTTHNTSDQKTYNVTDTETPNVTVEETFTNYHEKETDTRSITTTFGKITDRDDTTTGSSSVEGRNVFSDTPMSMLSQSGSPSISGLDYATNVTYDDSVTTTRDVLDGRTVDSGSDTEAHSGMLDKNITGSKAESTTGTTTDKRTGTETLTKSGTDTDVKSGTETTDKTGTISEANSVEREITRTDEGSSTKNETETQETIVAKSGTSSGTSATNEAGSSTSTENKENVRDFTEFGRNHNQAWLLKEFASNYINIDMMIIQELEPLFMGVW